MPYFLTPKLIFPLKNYKVNSYKFGEKCWYNKKYWGVHLGEDVDVKTGTKVMACGRGKVVYSALHAGSKEKPNWGNIMIVAHKCSPPILSGNMSSRPRIAVRGGNNRKGNIFFSLYAHLGKRLVKKDDKVELGNIIGRIGKKNTKENGWWKDEHLHFAIYTGKWKGKILPGYWKPMSKRTKLSDWKKPSEFIKNYVSN